MPMIQNSTVSPAALRGTPQRGSMSASACASARSSVASARCGHRGGDLGLVGALFDVEHRQPLEHQLARDAQRAHHGHAVGLERGDQRGDRREVGQARRAGGRACRRSAGARAARSGCAPACAWPRASGESGLGRVHDGCLRHRARRVTKSSRELAATMTPCRPDWRLPCPPTLWSGALPPRAELFMKLQLSAFFDPVVRRLRFMPWRRGLQLAWKAVVYAGLSAAVPARARMADSAVGDSAAHRGLAPRDRTPCQPRGRGSRAHRPHQRALVGLDTRARPARRRAARRLRRRGAAPAARLGGAVAALAAGAVAAPGAALHRGRAPAGAARRRRPPARRRPRPRRARHRLQRQRGRHARLVLQPGGDRAAPRRACAGSTSSATRPRWSSPTSTSCCATACARTTCASTPRRPPTGATASRCARARRQPLFSYAGDWRRWTGTLYADLPRGDVAQLKRHVDLPFELDGGQGSLRLWLDFQNNHWRIGHRRRAAERRRRAPGAATSSRWPSRTPAAA